jgi:hypothetical protein
MDAAEAAYVASVGGSTLLGFNIGNEPELFVKKGLRPAGWGYNDYIDEWKADRNAVLAQVPSAKFFGPEVCCVSYWFPSFLRDAGENGTLVAGSVHHYISNGGPGNAGGITPQGLLSPQAMNKFKQTEKGWVTEASKEGLPVDITEINTISNGGMAGVSNSFGATLWMSDVLFQSALLGIHQMSFQEVPGASYAFIDTQGYPRIIYLGLLFFSVATAHAALLPSLLNSAENVATYVLKGTNGTLRVVVINKEPKQGIAITMQPGGRYQKMTILRMQAASLTSTSGATLGNTVPSASGAWHPSTQETELIRVGRATLNVPASSAALFTFSI